MGKPQFLRFPNCDLADKDDVDVLQESFSINSIDYLVVVRFICIERLLLYVWFLLFCDATANIDYYLRESYTTSCVAFNFYLFFTLTKITFYVKTINLDIAFFQRRYYVAYLSHKYQYKKNYIKLKCCFWFQNMCPYIRCIGIFNYSNIFIGVDCVHFSMVIRQVKRRKHETYVCFICGQLYF